MTDKLDYLEELGINAIELMPVLEFEGNDSWGYNPCSYFALDFLTPGKDYQTIIYADAPDADGLSGKAGDADDPAQHYLISTQTVNAGTVMTMKLARAGGFAISLKEM